MAIQTIPTKRDRSESVWPREPEVLYRGGSVYCQDGHARIAAFQLLISPRLTNGPQRYIHLLNKRQRYQAVFLEVIASAAVSLSLIHSQTRRPRSLLRLRASP